MSKFLFVVQGEGRGHLTQAISLFEILTNAGHQVVSVMVGMDNEHNLPTFFQEKIPLKVQTFPAPSLVYGQTKAVKVWDTIRTHCMKVGKYRKSIQLLAQKVEEHKPDVIVNFYDMICGLYAQFYRPSIPVVCIGHQYLLLHNEFISLPNKQLDRFLLNLNTRLTSLNSTRKLALSFVEMPDDKANFIAVTPPLLRDEVKRLTPKSKPFILAYITHHKLSEDIINWHSNHRDVQIHCFWNNKEFADEWQFRENLTFHQVNSEKFLTMMQECSGLVCTAGFESVCEAMYLGKPIMMVPVPNHIEQQINALDGERAGAGIADTVFNFNRFIEYLPVHENTSENFKNWQGQTSQLFLRHLEEVAQEKMEVYTFKKESNNFGKYFQRGLKFRF
ncbi:glycosyltransferase family protein [Arcicella sp. LKC2W]|uniref:glycosyltransferase family protein n=1 Tax=Arcicella sp. LKC2W TaxID=2984198 RepID=UPI002B213F49|nr:glycosyltransferase family protein [Arcicella sp. LKC2W]MEA5457428.1 glycosyltransferase family protein [Arcicella sp. LKC2W]